MNLRFEGPVDQVAGRDINYYLGGCKCPLVHGTCRHLDEILLLEGYRASPPDLRDAVLKMLLRSGNCVAS